MEQLTRQKLIADHAPGGKHNPAKPIGPAEDGAWWLERNRFGTKTKLKIKVSWEGEKPIFGDIEYHIYRQPLVTTRGVYGKVANPEGLPELMESVWGHKELTRALKQHRMAGHRVFQLTVRLDGEQDA